MPESDLNRIILIVGPSGIGKSSVIQAIEPQFPRFAFEALDRIAASYAQAMGLIPVSDVQILRSILNDDERFFGVGVASIRNFVESNPGATIVIDVGAGFQVARQARDLSQFFHVLAITAEPSVAHARIVAGRNDPRSLDRYIRDEFNADRIAVYESAQHRVDTGGQSLEETVAEVASIIRSLSMN